MSTSTTQKPTTRRIVGMVVGIVIIGLGIALFKQSHLGNDSISALNMRLAELLGISLGVQNVATNILFFALEFWFGRKYIGLGTFVNGIGMGFIITFFYDPIAAAFGPAASLPEQLVWVVLAVLVTALGASSTRRLTSALRPTITSRWVCGTTRTSSTSAAASSPTPSAPCSAGFWAVLWVWVPSSARSASDPSSSSSTASSPSGSCSISPKKHEHNEKDICRRRMSFCILLKFEQRRAGGDDAARDDMELWQVIGVGHDDGALGGEPGGADGVEVHVQQGRSGFDGLSFPDQRGEAAAPQGNGVHPDVDEQLDALGAFQPHSVESGDDGSDLPVEGA